MIKKALLFLLLVVIAVGCSKERHEGKIFRMNTHSEPFSLDPRFVRDIPTITVSKMLFDGLTRPNLDGKIELAIAEKVSISPDKMHYRFFLREALWSNGLPVTAYDFEYAWKSLLSKDFPAEFAHQLYVIKNGKKAKTGELSKEAIGVKALSERELVVDLEYPDPFFLETVASPIAYPVPKELLEKGEPWCSSYDKGLVSNGPFRLVSFKAGSDLIAEKNPSYFDADAVKLDKVILTHIEDEHTELNMYENNELDWAGSPNSSIPPEALPSLKNLSELHIIPIAGTFSYKFNTKAAPFDSLLMRKAFALAINRKSLVENVLQANQIVAHAFIPPCLKQDKSPPLISYDYNEESAKEFFELALNEKGLTRETLPPITLIFSKSEKHQKIAQAIQQEWSRIFNIKIQLQSYEWNTYLEHLSKGNFQVGGKGWVSDLSDPQALLEMCLLEEGSKCWQNPKFTQVLEEAKAESSLPNRLIKLREAEEILMAEVPVAPLYHSTACYLQKPYVKDVYLSKLCDIDLKHASIQR